MSEDNKLTVNLYRDGSIESSHEVNLYSNKKQYDDYFFPRSSVKPMQVIPLLLEATNQNIEFTSEEIALFAASQKTRPLLIVSVLLSVTYAFVAVAALPDVF